MHLEQHRPLALLGEEGWVNEFEPQATYPLFVVYAGFTGLHIQSDTGK